jgi:3-phosphoshikimate 1-carboxyvinyltransferase
MDLTIPGDISSAAFFLVGGLLGKTSSITLRNTGVNPTRTGILEVLKAMGGEVVLKNVQAAGGEAVADLHVSSKDLVATSVGGALIPRLIDELPILAVAMAAAQGTSAVRNAEELRVPRFKPSPTGSPSRVRRYSAPVASRVEATIASP